MLRRTGREFLDFIQHGNVVDLAVAVIIGSAFSKVVTALVDLITASALKPTMQKLGIDRLDLWPVGVLLSALINFIVVALILFAVIKAFERLKRKQLASPAKIDPQQRLAESIDRLAQELHERNI